VKISSLRDALARLYRFAVNDIWDIELSSLSAIRRLGVATLRVVHLVVKGFRDDECPLHASALTYSTLMAIVPVLALSLALARVFGGDDLARDKIKGIVAEWTVRFEQAAIDMSPGAGDVTPAGTREAGTGVDSAVEAPLTATESTLLARRIQHAVDGIFDRVAGISFAALGGVGLIILLWTVVAVLGTVEGTFNRVWGVSVGRSIWRRFTDYIAVVVVLPFLAIAASTFPVVEYVMRFLRPEYAEQVRLFLLSDALKNITVILMTGITFTFLIMFMPNTRVRFLAGVSGGFVACMLFLAWLWVCASFQVWVAGYGRIYGSFALIPIMLAWVYVSWEIVLFGAEVAFSIQNVETYRMEQGARRASLQAKLILSLAVLVEAARAMAGKRGALSIAGYAGQKRVPVRLLNEVTDELLHTGMLGELAGSPGVFVLLRAPETLAVSSVFKAIMNAGVQPGQLGLVGLDDRIERAVNQAAGEQSGLGSLYISDLAVEG